MKIVSKAEIVWTSFLTSSLTFAFWAGVYWVVSKING